jgi:hypothetical protein
MKQANMLIASAAVIALTLGVTSRADPSKESEPSLPLGSFIIAADESQADTAGNDHGSAKIGEESGTQNGAGSPTLENDTGKIDQSAGGNPPAGEVSE